MSERKKGTIYAVIAMCCYALVPTIVKLAYSSGLNTSSLLFGRFFIAFVIGMLTIKAKGLYFPCERKTITVLIVMSLFAGMSNILFNEAYKVLHSIVSTVISLLYVKKGLAVTLLSVHSSS